MNLPMSGTGARPVPAPPPLLAWLPRWPRAVPAPTIARVTRLSDAGQDALAVAAIEAAARRSSSLILDCAALRAAEQGFLGAFVRLLVVARARRLRVIAVGLGLGERQALAAAGLLARLETASTVAEALAEVDR